MDAQVEECKIIDEKLYNYFANKLKKNNNLECIVKYEELYALICEMRNMNKYNLKEFQEENEIFYIFELLMLSCGLFSLSTADCDNFTETKVVFFSLFTQITNNLSSIMHLSLKGLNYQVGIISRSLYEILFLLPVLLIDSEKRKLYFESAKNDNANEVWNKEFRFSQLNECLREYEEKVSKGNRLRFLKKTRFRHYSSYSEYTHNSFIMAYLNSYTKKSFKDDDDNDELLLNIWGQNNAKAEINFNNICSLMSYISILLQNIFSKETRFYFDEIKNEKSQEYWNMANYLLIIFRNIYLYKYYNIKD